MAFPELASRRTPLVLGAALILLLVGAVALAWGLGRFRRPTRILLVTQALPQGQTGLEPYQERAIGSLVQDALEVAGGHAVTLVSRLPEGLGSLHGQSNVLLVLLEPRRSGESLGLTYRFVRGGDIGKDGALAWTSRPLDPTAPGQAFEAFFRGFPLTIKGTPPNLVPKSPGAFWDVIRAGAWRLQNVRMEEALALAERTVRQEPDCATAWILLGNLRYRWMLNSPAAFRQEQAETEVHLQRGLALVPSHPRGAFLLSLLKADNGNQREALDLLMQARRRQPNNPTLLTGVAYAARGAGLLPLARKAMDIRDHLAFAEFQPQALDITCLYTGELPRFAASLRDQPGHLRNTSGVTPFYRGYLALVQGDTTEARQEFHRATASINGYPNITRLSRIFELILEGQRDEAWQQLREYDQERIGMREPDGEFTIRLAEAYAMLGDRASAMEMAARAFSRGFGCTAWYERSPMLEPLRGLPKWKALIQHLKERQSLMEDRFPLTLLDEG